MVERVKGRTSLSFWLIALLVWIAPAVLLGGVLLWVRFKTSAVAYAPTDSDQSLEAANDAEEIHPQFAMLVAAE